MANFIMVDGPQSNTYTGPSGKDYWVEKGLEFQVKEPADIEYFARKDTFRQIKPNEEIKEIDEEKVLEDGGDKNAKRTRRKTK